MRNKIFLDVECIRSLYLFLALVDVIPKSPVLLCGYVFEAESLLQLPDSFLVSSVAAVVRNNDFGKGAIQFLKAGE
jgi:hypothetical protein